MKTLVLALLLLASPALAAPKCDSYSYCVGSETRIWEQTYSAAFVYFSEDKGYDDNAAAGMAEGVADRALKICKARHKRPDRSPSDLRQIPEPGLSDLVQPRPFQHLRDRKRRGYGG